MGRTKSDVNVEPITKARRNEKARIEEAKERARAFVQAQTADAHAIVLSAIRDAYLAGASKRQIAVAYGSSDPYTINALIAKATAGIASAGNAGEDSSWKLTPLEDGAYSLQVWQLGDDKRTGEATITLDDDSVNFTAIDGDLWVSTLIYRLGLVGDVIKEIHGRA